MVVLDDQQMLVPGEDLPEGRGPVLVHRRAIGVLRAGHGEHRLGPALDRSSQCLGDEPELIDLDRDGDQAERDQQIEDADVRRVLDDHAIARTQMGLKDALGAVERPGHDGERVRAHPVSLERRTSEREQLRVGRLETAHRELLREVDAPEGRLEVGEQLGIGEPDRQVAHAGGQRRLGNIAAGGR